MNSRKDAIQRTIEAMTLGKDVSALFPDVIKNLSTHDLSQKKLVYLYLMNYAKTHPELCILAVNTFVQDSEDPNPLVRALSIRTMGCIRVDKMVDYLGIPLRRTLKDDDPYVRKTAAIGVAKLFDLNPQLCIEEGFLDDLKKLLTDSNHMVLSNAVAALMEIQQNAPETECFNIDSESLNSLLLALSECTEWGRITLLSALSDYYTTADVREAEYICERVVPQFQHANPSVVLAAIKSVLVHMHAQTADSQEALLKKMSSPLVSLVSCVAEVQYVALRNIRIILQKYPNILSRELRVFFCKYNDPLYLKFEKLEIMVLLANEKNADQLVNELKEYSMEVDIEFVRRSIKAIGQTAIKIESSAEKCVNVLLDLLDNKANYVIQEVAVVIKDILRRYKGRFEGALSILFQNFDEIDEPESKAAIVWILGEYPAKIENASEILDGFIDTFMEEAVEVQLQLITAAAKLYIQKPDSGQGALHRILEDATQKSDNADIRDRAYIYWRLLSSDGSVARDVVFAEKPPIDTTIESLPPALVDQLIDELGTLASVFLKPAATFMGTGKFGSDAVQKRAIEEQRQLAKEDAVGGTDHNIENLLDLDFADSTSSANGTPPPESKSSLGDLGDIFASSAASPAPTAPQGGSSNQDILSMFGSSSGSTPAAVNSPVPSSDLTNAFEGLSFGTTAAPATKAPPAPVENKSANDDLIGLF